MGLNVRRWKRTKRRRSTSRIIDSLILHQMKWKDESRYQPWGFTISFRLDYRRFGSVWRFNRWLPTLFSFLEDPVELAALNRG